VKNFFIKAMEPIDCTHWLGREVAAGRRKKESKDRAIVGGNANVVK